MSRLAGKSEGDRYRRDGDVTLPGGESAALVIVGTHEPPDAKGWPRVKARSDIRFKDGSTLVVDFEGVRNPATNENSGTGRFISGTGRFAGISGDLAYVGTLGETRWRGSYSLKPR